MKKVLILLMLLVVSCGGSSDETVVEDTTTTTVQDTTTTTVQDTTTTTIPPVPTSDINYIELFNSKLGTELCSDAKEIDTTSEECLRQYKENLNYLITLQNEIGDFGSDLIAYYETYPELVNQEYEDYINFIENEYSQVFTAANDVENKYIERFGGSPILSEINFDDLSNLSVGCEVGWSFEASENFNSGSLLFKNNSGEFIEVNIFHDDLSGYFKLMNTGGVFKLESGTVKNFLNEEFQISLNSFFVEHLFHRISKVEIPSSITKGQKFEIKISVEPVSNVEIDRITINFLNPLNSSFDNSTIISTNSIQDGVATFYANFLTEPFDPSSITYIGSESNPIDVYFENGIGDYKLGMINIYSKGSNVYDGYYINSKDASNGYSMPLASRCGQLDQYQINPLNYNELLLKINK